MAQQAYAVNKKLQNVQKANYLISYTAADKAINQGVIMKFKKCVIQMFTVVGICSLSVSSAMAEKRSVENEQSLTEMMKENPILAYAVPSYDHIWVSEVESFPREGSLRLDYNNDEKTRASFVLAKKLPSHVKHEDAMDGFLKAAREVLDDGKKTLIDRRFKTDKGHEVECLGFISEKAKRSHSLCVTVFEHYYVQANLAWDLDDERRGDEVFSRSDDFVTAVFDKFSEYEGI